LDVVKLLLADKRVDPSADDQLAIRMACEDGQLEVVKLLLADERVDPSVSNSCTILGACAHGHTEIAQLLLADKRVDPSENHSFRFACSYDHPAIVKLLLADERIDVSADSEFALQEASRCDYVEVARLLLSDRRVDPLSVSQLTSYAHLNRVILSLHLLRRSVRIDFQTQASTFTDELDYTLFVADIEKIESQRKALLDAQLLVSDLSALCLEYVPDLFCHLDVENSSLIDPNSNSKFPRFSFSSLSSL
jgi:ankyrin repeat protein